jgi:hypothetical protein
MPVEPASWQADQDPIQLKAIQSVTESNSEVRVLIESDSVLGGEAGLTPAQGRTTPVEFQAPPPAPIKENSRIWRSPISVITVDPAPAGPAAGNPIAGWIYTFFKLEPSPYQQPAEPVIPSV